MGKEDTVAVIAENGSVQVEKDDASVGNCMVVKFDQEEKYEVRNIAGMSEDEERMEKNVSKENCVKTRPRSTEEIPKNTKAVEEKIVVPETRTSLASSLPVRERKSVERLIVTIDKDYGKKLQIEKGLGTSLKYIPNVAYNISRKKNNETSKLLHTVLFGRRGKEHQTKSNLSQFSGFVWHVNEEKEKIELKQKLNKFVKEKLLEFCDMLDLPIATATTNKEDIVEKLFDFLEAPHAITSDLLADIEPWSKCKRKRSSQNRTLTGKVPSRSSSKSPKRSRKASKGANRIEMAEKDDEHEGLNDYGYGDEDNVHGGRYTSKDEKAETLKNEEKKHDSESEMEEAEDKEKIITQEKSGSNWNAGKMTVKEMEKPQEEKLHPSDAELRTSICEILKEVDINTTTFTDILKILVRYRSDAQKIIDKDHGMGRAKKQANKVRRAVKDV